MAQIFLSDGTTGYITDTYTIATGDSSVTSREIHQENDSTTERVLFMDCADDDSSTPTIKVEISLYYGSGWSDWSEIESASAVAKEVNVASYNQSWWKKNQGVKFKITKSGAGAVTITNARWI